MAREPLLLDLTYIATDSDAEAITALVNSAYRPGPGVAGWTHEADLVAGSRTTINQVKELIAKPASYILIGVRNSELVACVHIEKDGDKAYIGMLAVHPVAQGSGVGKEILAVAEQYASSTIGTRKFVMVVVSARTELIAFYLRRGYERTGAVMDYPLSAGAGTPKHTNLKVEILEKRFV